MFSGLSNTRERNSRIDELARGRLCVPQEEEERSGRAPLPHAHYLLLDEFYLHGGDLYEDHFSDFVSSLLHIHLTSWGAEVNIKDKNTLA